jgi:hypothetical protein
MSIILIRKVDTTVFIYMKLSLINILTEGPEQTIKFLKLKNLDPSTNPEGKQIFDTIGKITGGDGYRFILTKFYVNDKISVDDLSKIHEYIVNNKEYLNKLPKPIVNYETYFELFNDIHILEHQRAFKRLYIQLSPVLKQQLDNLLPREKEYYMGLAKRFEVLTAEQQRFFMKKVFAFKILSEFRISLGNYIVEAENRMDYSSTKQRIISTPDAYIIYENPDQEIIVVHVNSFNASQQLGCTSSWCISQTNQRFNQYRRGSKKYFFIWDFKLFINNDQFFLALVYNEKNPKASDIYGHIDNTKNDLNTVLNSKGLNFEIFNTYLLKFNENENKNNEVTTGIFNALKTKNKEKIIEAIQNSEAISQYHDVNDEVEIDYNNLVWLSLTKDDMIQLLELGDEYEYIEGRIHNYNGSNRENDYEDHMHYGLSDKNMKLILDLAKKVGYPKRNFEKLKTEQGHLSIFLRKYEFEDIIEIYNSEYADALYEADADAAKDLISQIPFDVENATFKIDKMTEYYIDNNLTADTFDQLIEEIKTNLPSFSIDIFGYLQDANINLYNLNNKVKEKLKEIIEDIEWNDDNIYHEKYQLLQDTYEYLSKMGFKILHNSDNIAELKLKNINILVTNVEKVQQEDDSFKIYVNANIFDNDKISGTMKKVKVPITSLKNYVDQLELKFLNEQIHRIKTVINEIDNDNFSTGDGTNDFDDLSSEDRAERLFGKQTNLQYYITDPKHYYDPWNIFDTSTMKCEQTPEIERLRRVIRDFRDIESGHEPTIDDFLNPTF